MPLMLTKIWKFQWFFNIFIRNFRYHYLIGIGEWTIAMQMRPLDPELCWPHYIDHLMLKKVANIEPVKHELFDILYFTEVLASFR